MDITHTLNSLNSLDAKFPTLPRWFTASLNAPLPRAQIGPDDNVEESAIARLPVPSNLPHDHALLEHLFESVFHNRFLNPTPSCEYASAVLPSAITLILCAIPAIIPSYFAAFFGQVVSPPVIHFPMPPIAPLQLTRPGAVPPTEPRRRSDTVESTDSSMRSSQSNAFSDDSGFAVSGTRIERSGSVSTAASSVSMATTSLATAAKCTCGSQYAGAYLQADGTRIGCMGLFELLPVCPLAGIDEHTLFFLLRRALGQVLALKEAMWDDLRERIEQDAESLLAFGWELTDFDLESSRHKFDAMIEQYKK